MWPKEEGKGEGMKGGKGYFWGEREDGLSWIC